MVWPFCDRSRNERVLYDMHGHAIRTEPDSKKRVWNGMSIRIMYWCELFSSSERKESRGVLLPGDLLTGDMRSAVEVSMKATSSRESTVQIDGKYCVSICVGSMRSRPLEDRRRIQSKRRADRNLKTLNQMRSETQREPRG